MLPSSWLLSVFALSAAPANERPVVAVWNLEGKGVALSASDLGRLTERLAGLLLESGRYQITPRAEVVRILAAQKRTSYRACFDESCQIELGKELAAQKSLSGSVERWGEHCVVSLRLFDLARATGEAAGSAKGGCKPEEVFELLGSAVQGLGGPVRASAPAAQSGSDADSVSHGVAMRLVPGGDFFRGCNQPIDEQCFVDEKPGRVVMVEAFQIDTHEVTVAGYRECVRAGSCSAAGLEVPVIRGERQAWTAELCNWGKQGRDDHPINCVTWTDSDRYCRWVKKRLPSEPEWEKAARGAADRRHYPWGFEGYGARRVANVADWTATKAYRNLKSIDGYEDGFAGTAPVGTYPFGASAAGALDMAGNVAEWTSDWYAPPKLRAVRGGSWRDLAWSTRVSARASAEPLTRDPAIGFRCAASQ